MNATITPQNSIVPYTGGTIIFQVESDVAGILESNSLQPAGVNHLPLASLSTTKFEPGITIVEFEVFDRAQIGIDPDIITPETPLGHGIMVECINPATQRYTALAQADIIQQGLIVAPEPVLVKSLIRKGKGRK